MKEQYRGMMIGGIAGLLLGVLVMMLFGQGDLENVAIEGGQNGFTFKLRAKEIVENKSLTREVLDTIWTDKNAKPVLVDWLTEKEYFSITDDEEIEKRLKKLLPNDNLARKIIALRDDYEGPFQVLADSARIVVPKKEFPEGVAYTWRGSKLAGKMVEFSYPGSRIPPIKLKCTDDLGARPNLRSALPNSFHVSENVFNALVGEENRDPRRAAEGWVYVALAKE